jgi:hypothetical protein
MQWNSSKSLNLCDKHSLNACLFWGRTLMLLQHLNQSSWNLVYIYHATWDHLSDKQNKQTLWPESASELYWPSDRRLSAKLAPTFAAGGCCMVSAMDSYSRILDFLDQGRYFFFQVAPQLYSRGWVDPVPGLLLLIKSSRTGNRTRTSGSIARNSDC